jgi:5'-methylthioadenosine phosphorylase
MMKIGIIGGSGLENPEILTKPEERFAETPYGQPSSSLLCGSIRGADIILLSRHGRDHTIPPTEINNRANIFALKDAGCSHIIATTACGSLREDINRGDLVIPDQFIDFTRHRIITFYNGFEPGKMRHSPMADPFDENLRQMLITSANRLGLKIHGKGTVITIEGPRFSTRAESKMFRLWGADIVNMSLAPEVTLANELEIPYAAVAISTDYDCWKEDEKSVTWEEVIRVFKQNVDNVLRLLLDTIDKMNQI